MIFIQFLSAFAMYQLLYWSSYLYDIGLALFCTFVFIISPFFPVTMWRVKAVDPKRFDLENPNLDLSVSRGDSYMRVLPEVMQLIN